MSNQESTTGDDSSDDYKRTTLYLRPDVKRSYERWFKMLELNMFNVDSQISEDAEKREMHEALIAVAMAHPDEFIDRLEARQNDPAKFEVTLEDLAEP